MDYDKLLKENKLLKEQNENLTKELEEIKEHLKKYTAPSYKKIYYENNKEEIKQKNKEYRQNHQPTEEQKNKYVKDDIFMPPSETLSVGDDDNCVSQSLQPDSH
jgi:dsDNA-specific endonuclease/ATPase MutS2